MVLIQNRTETEPNDENPELHSTSYINSSNRMTLPTYGHGFHYGHVTVLEFCYLS